MAEHINSFENGMTKDVNVIFQPPGTIRHMVNCSLVSQDGNNYVIKDCLGNVRTIIINPPYNGVYTLIGDFPMPIGFISFPDKLIVFSTNNNTTGGPGEIGMIRYLPYGEGVAPLSVAGQYHAGYVPLYYHESLNFSQLHRIEGFGFTENELIERVYWTDNFNQPRVFNVSDPIFTTYIPTGSLVVGQQYMVLEGAITHNTKNYGPGLADKNVFTAANANYTNLTGTSPTPKVVQYYPVQLLDFTPSRSLGNIIFNKYGIGSLNCGSKIYFYRLGKNDSGIVTSWSYGSSPVPVGTLNVSTSLTAPTVPYHDFVGAGTTTTLVNSGLSNFINIENIDTAFDYVELSCAEFDELIDVPRQITIVSRSTISGSTITIEHTGNINLGTLTISDVTLFPASLLKVKTLTTSKNYILAGNITERQELDIDVTTATLNVINYPMNVHRDAASCSLSGMVYSGVSPTTGVNPTAGSVTPYSRWKVTVGQPIYNGVTYAVGEVITGVPGAGNDSIDFATHAGSQARPCVTKNRYTSIATGKRVENSIELQGVNPDNTCFWDYKSAAAHHHVPGYWSGEKYRFGVLFYDLKGNPFFVKYLSDFTFPTVAARIPIIGGILNQSQIGNTGNSVYSVVPQGLVVSGLTIPPGIIDQISGFSIVRAERDARIVSQGLVTQNVDTGASPKVYRPAAYNPIAADLFNVADRVYTYLCPDQLVGVPLKNTFGIIGDTMEEASWVLPFDYGVSQFVRGAGTVAGSEQVYTKYLSCANDGSIRTGTLTYFDSVDESKTLSNFGAGVTYQNGSMQIDPAAGTVVVGVCVPGSADYTLDGFNATGCKKSVFRLATDFKHYGPSANDFTSVAAMSQTEKILMNYVKTGFTNPYGGTGPEALASTLYISTGHFQPITVNVKNDTFDGNNYVFNNIEVFGGDCYTCLIDQGYALWDFGFPADRYSYAWTFPCECNANYNLRRGRKTSNVEMYYTGTVLTQSITVLDPSSNIRLEDYSYNQGYSTEGQVIVYPALPVNFINASQFRFRIRFAGQKFIGEIMDSFRTFAINDFKDLDGQGGEINNIKVKDGRVVVWQNKLTSTVPILERQLLGAVAGDATTIGTGGVVDRFDPLNSFFGNQHQWSLIETEYGFAWFDMRRKAFVVLSFAGGGMIEESLVQGLEGYFNEAFLEVELSGTPDKTVLLNSPTFDPTSDRPLIGVGITGVFDPKFKMTYLTFKFYGQNSTGFKSKDFTIGYLHTDLKKCFVGFYDWFPAIAHNHNQIVLSVNNPKNTTQYLTSVLTNKSFVPGDTLWGASTLKQNEYINILAVTLDNVAKFPEGASGSTYWTLINSINEIWVHNQPILLNSATPPDYQYDSFFGHIVDNEVQVIVNPKTQNPFSVLNIEQVGPFNVNFTDVYTDAVNQSASDTSIATTNKFYRFIYDRITSSLPLSSTGRITNSYLRIRFVKKNWTTDPTRLTGAVKIFEYLKSFFVEKR